MLLRNTNPCGDVEAWDGTSWRPVKAGEEVDFPDDVAGYEPGPFTPVETPEKPWLARQTEDGTWEEYDPGVGLLSQVGNWERVKTRKAKDAPVATPAETPAQ